MDFGIGMTSAYGRTMISVSGDVDPQTVAPLRSALSAAARNGDVQIHVDMRDVTAIDDDGLRCLVDAADELAAAGKALHLVQASRAVVDALKASGDFERFSPGLRS